MAKRLHDVQNESVAFGVFTALSLALPTVLVTACCLVILLAVLGTRGCGGSSMARCNDCCLIRLGSIFITLSVFVAAVVAASECLVGVVSSSFCRNVDPNVLAYAQDVFGSNSTEYKASYYYITGLGDNPLNETLVQGKIQIAKANTTFADLEQKYGTTIRSQCQGWTAAPITQDLGEIYGGLEVASSRVSRGAVYPYYKAVVQDDMCTTVIAGLGWLVVCQLIVGLCCLPALAVMSASFFTRWAAWKDSLATGNPEVFLIENQVLPGQQAV